jgi:hypothetical protein
MKQDQGDEIRDILRRAKKLAQRYRQLTGKPLGVAGEVAEYEASVYLDLELVAARQAGYDAVQKIGKRRVRLSIKGRCVLPGQSPSQRLGRIDINKPFDAVLLVLMDERLNATAIYEAPRVNVVAALMAPGSKARNERGALSVSKFKSIAKCVWKDAQGAYKSRLL